MTNSSRETDIRVSGPYPVATPPETGTQAPLADTSSGTAGGAATVAPRRFTASEVFEALVSTVAEFEAAGKHATAAGVSARMRQLLPGFSLDATEFKTFREITEAAERSGFVTAVRTPSDYVLSLVRSQEFRGETLLPDLWRAIQDWTEGVTYAFHRGTRKTEPVGGAVPAGAVEAPSVDKAANTQWMRDFAATQRGEVARSLNEALGEDDPIDGFMGFLRRNESVKRRWNKFLRSRVLETAIGWAKENGIPRSDIFSSPAEKPASQSTPQPNLAAKVADEDTRRRVLEVLASMPLHELLRLPIPLEYSLKR